MSTNLEGVASRPVYFMADWLEADAGHRPPAVDFSVIYPAETLFTREPAQLKGGTAFFPNFQEMPIPPIYVARLHAGRLCADESNTAILAPDGNLIMDVSYGHEARAEDHWFFTAELPKAEHRADVVASLTLRPGWSSFYYHWMFEILPRIHLLQLSGITIDKYAVHPLHAPFQYQTLATVGIPEAKLLELTEATHLVATELVVPSMLQSVMPHWACHFLRETFLSDHDQTRRDRLYLSRAGAARGRRVENEAEVVAVLAAHGFRTVSLDDMTVEEQARLFAGAEYVAGPHGGAFTNLVFCDPGTKVIEFFAREYVQPLYWMLSSRRGLEYCCLVGKGDGPQGWSWWPPDGGVDPIEVDIDALVEVLSTSGA